MVPAADRRAGGGLSTIVHVIFAVITLEGPRLMLISRYRAACMKRGTKVGLSAVSGTAVAAIVIATVIVSSQIMAVVVDGKVVGYVANAEQYASLVQKAKVKISEQVGTENTEIVINNANVSLEPVIAPQMQPMTPAPAPATSDTTGSAGATTPDTSGSADVTATGTSGSANAAVQDTASTAGSADAAVQDTASTAGGADATVQDTASTAGDTETTVEDTAVAKGQGPGIDVMSAPSGQTDPADPAANEDALVDNLIGSLMDTSAITATVYTITIDGEVMATLGTMKEASDVLNAIADKYKPDSDNYDKKFLEDITINSETVALDSVKVQKADDVVNFLLTGSTEDKSYVAVKGDSIDNICQNLGVSQDELRAAYPDYNFKQIKEGDEFDATITTPYIQYQTSDQETQTEEVPFDTIEETSDQLFLGQRETKTEGVPGERSVTSTVTRVNGKVVSTVESDSVTIKEPVAQVVQTGTKMVFGPSDGSIGGGPLGRPLISWVLSRGVSAGHTGDDMAAPKGTPIFAAEHGTVIHAGVYGSYGNLVIIDHGNGLQTYYAHCDTMIVSVGQVVERGQQIATVGTTGHSTGPHLHFEVRVNGAVQEPLNWIN